eukprot:9855832-Alexandrium_andersonii.AAC.1
MEPSPRDPLGTFGTALLVARFGISANNGAERTPQKVRGSMLRPLFGPRRSSSSERLKRCRIFG